MSGRQGGKKKPLKQAKKGPKDEDEDDAQLKQKQRDDKKAMDEAKTRAAQKGPMGGAGLKKSTKK